MAKDTMLSGVMTRPWERIVRTMTQTDRVPDLRGTGHDKEVFEKVAVTCFQSVLPKKVWSSNCGKKRLSEFLTVADEALAYLVLENNLVDWLKISRKQVEDTKKRKRDTKYTLVGSTAGQKGGGSKKGWSEEGKKRYNEYYDLVLEARRIAGNIEMEKELLKEWREEDDINEGRSQDQDKDVTGPGKKKRFVPRSGFDSALINFANL